MLTSTNRPQNVTHHLAEVEGADLHYVTAGQSGEPVLLVHGFPETWHAFHKVIPLLAEHHRVVAVDMRGFGGSRASNGEYGSTASAQDLRQLVEHLDLGPVHLVAQDIAGATAFRFAANHPGHVRSFTAIEMGLAGFGLEGLADVRNGGSWHIGVLGTPGVAELLFTGRERELLGRWAFPSMTAVQGAITDADVEEFASAYAEEGGWRGAAGLYASMLTEGEEIAALAAAEPLRMPVLAIGAGGGGFTASTMAQVSASEIREVQLDGVGHYAAMEAPERVATAILDFVLNLGGTGDHDARDQR